jgi:hypothetical protein
MAQLALNLTSLVVAGTTVLTVQRVFYARRRRSHLREDTPPLPRPEA